MPTVTVGDNTGQTHPGVENGQIKLSAPTTNYGTQTQMETTKYNAGDHTHTLLKFTGLSAITGPVTVSAATINIYAHDASSAAAHIISLRRILRNTVELQATWNVYSTGNSWTTAGCLSDGNDRVAAVTGTLVIATTAAGYRSFTNAQLAADIQDMINNPSTNFGWHLERTDGANDATYLVWRGADFDAASSPFLQFTWVAGGATWEQEGYQWRRDDGSETTATSIGAQDTPL